MADYNIYIRTIGGDSGEGSAVKPFQTGGGDGGGEVSQFVSKTTSFISNPDTAIRGLFTTKAGAVFSSMVGGVGAVVAMYAAAIKITDTVLTSYHSVVDPLSGDYNFSINYGNFKKQLNNFMHPFSTFMSSLQSANEIKVQNARNNQLMQQFGGTIYNSKYGRYL